MKFQIEQIAITPRDPERAMKLLSEMGAGDWVRDLVAAEGVVRTSGHVDAGTFVSNAIALRADGYLQTSAKVEKKGMNLANLNFNYDLGKDDDGRALEFEVLDYVAGNDWMSSQCDEGARHSVSHLGMHCTEAELDRWKEFFAARRISIAQEVHTRSHTNPHIAGKRWYHYCIFDTRPILGVDLKFIVRRDSADA